MKRIALCVLAMLVGSDGARAANCQPVGVFHLSGEYPMHFNTSSGRMCESTFGSFGSNNFDFKRLNLLSPPTRGKLRLREGGYFMYTAPAGYKGTDVFKVQVCGSENGTPGCATLTFSVNVN